MAVDDLNILIVGIFERLKPHFPPFYHFDLLEALRNRCSGRSGSGIKFHLNEDERIRLANLVEFAKIFTEFEFIIGFLDENSPEIVLIRHN